MDKYEYIVNLAEKTAKRVSQNRESWMKFHIKVMYCIGSNKYMAVQTAQNPLKKELLKFQISSRRMPIQNFKLIIRIYRIG